MRITSSFRLPKQSESEAVFSDMCIFTASVSRCFISKYIRSDGDEPGWNENENNEQLPPPQAFRIRSCVNQKQIWPQSSVCGEVPPTLNGDEENNPNVNEEDIWGDFDDIWWYLGWGKQPKSTQSTCCLKVVTVVQMFYSTDVRPGVLQINLACIPMIGVFINHRCRWNGIRNPTSTNRNPLCYQVSMCPLKLKSKISVPL